MMRRAAMANPVAPPAVNAPVIQLAPTTPPIAPATDPGVGDVQSVLLDRHAVAAMLGISPTTLDSWRARGLVPPPCIVTTRIVRWSRTEMAAWVEARCPSADEWARRSVAAAGGGKGRR